MTCCIGQAPAVPFSELRATLATERAEGIARLSVACLRGALASRGAAAVTDTEHWPVIAWGGLWIHGQWRVTSPNPFRGGASC